MPFESGSFSLSYFRLSRALPENYLEQFQNLAACKFDEVKDEPNIGWVSGRHLLERDLNEQTVLWGGYPYLNLRIAERRIPSPLLKAITRREELAYMEAEKVMKVPVSIKKQIKEDIQQKYLLNIPPSLTGIPLVVDILNQQIYFAGSSQSQIDHLVSLFLKTHDMEPLPINFTELLAYLFKKSPTDLPCIAFSEQTLDDDPKPERDFLTWLWYFSETQDGKLKIKDHGTFHILIDGPVTFAFSSDETRGAAEMSVKKGCPLRSAEAKAALAVGKKLKKAKITIGREKELWMTTFDADKFSFSGVTLPEGDEMELHARFQERMHNLYLLTHIFEAYFQRYIETITHDQWPETEKKIQQWAIERESL